MFCTFVKVCERRKGRVRERTKNLQIQKIEELEALAVVLPRTVVLVEQLILAGIIAVAHVAHVTVKLVQLRLDIVLEESFCLGVEPVGQGIRKSHAN